MLVEARPHAGTARRAEIERLLSPTPSCDRAWPLPPAAPGAAPQLRADRPGGGSLVVELVEYVSPRPAPAIPIDLSVPGRYHVVGVGGPGMSAIALVLAQMGHDVSGSDLRELPILDRLRAAGVTVHVGHDRAHVHGVDAVTYSTAIPDHNIEVAEAREHRGDGVAPKWDARCHPPRPARSGLPAPTARPRPARCSC
ncbi:MAG: Mur ligase domain-containing protein [Ilumatobacteraceae bacterium]